MRRRNAKERRNIEECIEKKDEEKECKGNEVGKEEEYKRRRRIGGGREIQTQRNLKEKEKEKIGKRREG